MAEQKNEKSMTRAAGDIAVNAAVAIGAAALVGTGPVGLGVAAASVAVPGVLSMFADWNGQRRTKRWAEWIAAYAAADDDVDPEEVEAHLHAKASDPLVQAMIIEGARVVDEALAEEVVPVLARLTREYVSAGRKADAFFRGTRRMLGDLSSEELGALREMTRRVLSLGVVGETDQVRLTHEHPHRATTLECKWLIVGPDGKPTWRDAEDIGPVPGARRLFHLLKVNDLGTESGAGSFGPRSGPGIVQVPVETFARLWPLFG